MTQSGPWFGGCAPVVELRLRFSQRLLIAVICLHCSVAGLLVLLLDPALALGLCGVLCLSLWRCTRLPGLGWWSTGLVLASAHDDDSWTLTERGGQMLEARLEKGLSFGTALVFLRWSVRGQRNRDAVLFSDSCGPDALRRLRVLLRAAEVSGQAQRGPASGEAQKGA